MLFHRWYLGGRKKEEEDWVEKQKTKTKKKKKNDFKFHIRDIWSFFFQNKNKIKYLQISQWGQRIKGSVGDGWDLVEFKVSGEVYIFVVVKNEKKEEKWRGSNSQRCQLAKSRERRNGFQRVVVEVSVGGGDYQKNKNKKKIRIIICHVSSASILQCYQVCWKNASCNSGHPIELQVAVQDIVNERNKQ